MIPDLSTNQYVTALADAVVKGIKGPSTPEGYNELYKSLGIKAKHEGLQWIQKAIESISEQRPVEIVLHPEWLKNRSSDWTSPRSYIVPPCLLVKIGDAPPKKVSLWPVTPFVILDGYYPDKFEYDSFFFPFAYRYAQGKLSHIKLIENFRFSIRQDTDRHEDWHRIDTLRTILSSACGAKEVNEFNRRVKLLEDSSPENGCILKRTSEAFKDWKFYVDWKKIHDFGLVTTYCGHKLCEFEFNARVPQAKPFTIEDYARTVADALVKGAQPVIDKENVSHQNIYRGVYNLYMIVGPEPYPGLPLLNRYLKEIGGEDYELSIDPEWGSSWKDWTPSEFICNNPSLVLKGPDGMQRLLMISPNSPEIIWDRRRGDLNPELYVSSVCELKDEEWSVSLINYQPPTFKRDESIQILRDHGYHDEADNLEYLYGKLEVLFAEKKEKDGRKFEQLRREITSAWICKFKVPDDEVYGFAEYVDLWRSQKCAQAAGQNWVRVDEEFWMNRVFECLCKGEMPVFEKWEYLSCYNEFAKKLYKEVNGKNNTREEQLARLNTIIKSYDENVFFTSEDDCKTGHICSCSDGWHLTLHLPDSQLNLEMRPYGNAFNLRRQSE